jgi:biopolymer transport protein ExbD
MFQHCPIISQLPKTLRFSLPPDDPAWRSKPVTPASAQAFHHIRQERPGNDPILFCAEDLPHRRKDYAIVQRFRARYGDKMVTIIILAGATSLATIGAAEWVTSDDFAATVAKASADVQRRDLSDDTEFEALLEVTATIPTTASPWHVETKKPLKLFLNDSFNALHLPETLSIKVHDSKPEQVFVDGDDVRFGGIAYQQLLAVCEHLPAAGPKRIDLRVLQAHPAFHTSNGIPTLAQIETAVRENLKKHRFDDVLTIEAGHLNLRCNVQFL